MPLFKHEHSNDHIHLGMHSLYQIMTKKTMSELMHKARKEIADKSINDKVYSIANQLCKGCGMSHYEAIIHVLSIRLKRSNISIWFISTDYRENRTRVLKSSSVLESLEDDDNNIYVPGIHEKNTARPSSLDPLCLQHLCQSIICEE